MRPIVDAIASGARLTKADAARQAGSDPANQAIIQQIEESLRRRNPAVFLEMTFTPSSAGHKPIACPPGDCGCKETGGVSCSCSLINNGLGPFCMCLLCPPVFRPFNTIPEEEPVLTSLHIKGGRLQMPGGGKRPDGIIAVISTPPDAAPDVRSNLARYAERTLQSESWPEGLVIKVKSSHY